MNEQDLRVIKTKTNLEDAFLQLLKEKPLERITVTELCKKSGITRKTFYLHYENVPKYFEEFLKQLMDNLEDSLQKATDSHLKYENLEPQMIHIFDHVYKNKEFYQFIFNSNSSFAYYEMFFKRIRAIFIKPIQIKEKYSHVTQFEASYYANAILGVIFEWYLEGFQKSVDEMNRLLVNIVKL